MQLKMKEIENLLGTNHYAFWIDDIYANSHNQDLTVGTIGFINEPQTYASEDTEGDEASTGVEYGVVLNTDPIVVAKSRELGTGSDLEGVQEASDMVDSSKGGLNLHHNGTSPGDTDIPLIEVTLT